MPWRISASCSTSTVSYGAPRRSRMAIARLEKPHCGKSGVPFMNRTTSFLLTISAIRVLASVWVSLIVSLRLRRCGFKLQRMKFTPDPPPERRIDRLVLANAAHSLEASGDDPRGIMVAVPGKIADGDLGIRNRFLDQPLDLARRHRH